MHRLREQSELLAEEVPPVPVGAWWQELLYWFIPSQDPNRNWAVLEKQVGNTSKRVMVCIVDRSCRTRGLTFACYTIDSH